MLKQKKKSQKISENKKPANKPKNNSAKIFSSQHKSKMEVTSNENELTVKEGLFVEFYLGAAKFNATEAAAKAGYKGNRNTLAQVGFENLRKPKIAEIIKQRLSESAMSSEEVLSRLAKQARGSFADVLDDDGKFNLQVARERGADDLLKKLKIREKRYEYADDEEPDLVVIDYEYELYSAQSALELLGKHHGLFIAKDDDGKPLEQKFVVEVVNANNKDSNK